MNALLLDTHAVLWFLQGDARLGPAAKRNIEQANVRKHVSIASCWEIAIKSGLGKLRLGEPVAAYLDREFRRNSLQILPVSLEPVGLVETLPAHHKDPFDRLLIATAIVESVPIVSADVAFDAYPVQRIG